MKLKIEFDAGSPAGAAETLRMIGQVLLYEFNPGEWKRPEPMRFNVYPAGGKIEVNIAMEKP